MNSLHTRRLCSFIQWESFVLVDSLPCCYVPFTHEGFNNSAQAVIDYFMLSSSGSHMVETVYAHLDVENSSDYNIVTVVMKWTAGFHARHDQSSVRKI